MLAIASLGLAANLTAAWFVHGIGRSTASTRVLVLHLGGDAAGALAVIVSALVILAGGPVAADALASLVIASLLALDALKIHASCEGLLNEIPGYLWDDKAAERGEDAPIKADDHSIDALRYE